MGCRKWGVVLVHACLQSNLALNLAVSGDFHETRIHSWLCISRNKLLCCLWVETHAAHRQSGTDLFCSFPYSSTILELHWIRSFPISSKQVDSLRLWNNPPLPTGHTNSRTNNSVSLRRRELLFSPSSSKGRWKWVLKGDEKRRSNRAYGNNDRASDGDHRKFFCCSYKIMYDREQTKGCTVVARSAEHLGNPTSPYTTSSPFS